MITNTGVPPTHSTWETMPLRLNPQIGDFETSTNGDSDGGMNTVQLKVPRFP